MVELKKYIPKKFKGFLQRAIIKRKYKIKMANGVIVDLKSHFEGDNFLGANTEFSRSILGFASYIANNSIIRNAKIGRFCSIGDNVRTSLGIHPTNKFVSTSPSFFSLKSPNGLIFTKEQKFEEHKYIDDEKRYVVEIGNDVWIGNNVIIMDGIKIGDGAIIAAGSVVTKDVKPYTIVGGVPAIIIRKRFTDEQIEKLLNIKWWDWDINEIKKQINNFADINKFMMINKIYE